ncbi:hypothetical protein CDD80_664 [Ophiocordyceps camponoti-rufipedis]|uniref:Telomerase reverse transcriptase n=1 Tax=Ophiocordyceps camponoti-rufipedis TaxID=2004952 RepID=A0A2C5YL59_9HYPO|nr:hypothetical protein CDD80_664 [Ophiocordyceps camponoti-rufipedis]
MSRGAKRKRKHRDTPVKPCESPPSTPVQHLLQQHYATVQTLRDHLNCKLPSSSRLRRKKIAEIGSDLARLLDSTLICSLTRPQEPDATLKDGEFREFRSLSQKSDDSGSSMSNGLSSATEVQADIVNFAVWLLFKRHKGTVKWPNNILCDGYRKTNREGGPGGTAIPGIFSLFANPQAAALKTYPWPNLLALLGNWGQEVMTDLLVNCSVFVAVEESHGNYLQLSGALLPAVTPANGLRPPRRTPSDITLMKSSVFYSRPALTASGRVRPGFSPFHVLNKCPHVSHPIRSGRGSSRSETEACNGLNTTRVMMFLFPRQFGLRNVFTPETSNKDQAFSAYAAREAEMASFLGRDRIKLPKRLRGTASRLVQRLQVLHGRCSYTETLDHYCPTHLTPSGCTRRSRRRRTKQTLALPNQMPLVDVATPASCVSAFCQAIVSKMIPNQFWGDGDTMCHNKKTFLRSVDHFIKLRRFESMTLHEISQGG